MTQSLTINGLNWPPVKSELIDDKFKCPGCKQVLKNVHQAYDCGCRFCYDCLDNL